MKDVETVAEIMAGRFRRCTHLVAKHSYEGIRQAGACVNAPSVARLRPFPRTSTSSGLALMQLKRD